MKIVDDGIGFDTTKKYSGNGLNNLQKRIKQMNGTLTVHSEFKMGTTITVSFSTAI